MSNLRYFAVVLIIVLFLDIDMTAIVFGGRVVSLIALAVLLVALAVAVVMILKEWI